MKAKLKTLHLCHTLSKVVEMKTRTVKNVCIPAEKSVEDRLWMIGGESRGFGGIKAWLMDTDI